jgi:hypothetical protein
VLRPTPEIESRDRGDGAKGAPDAVHALHQQIPRRLDHGDGRLTHHRQRGAHERRPLGIVEGDDRQLFGARHAKLGQEAQHERGLVAVARYERRRRLAFAQRPRQLVAQERVVVLELDARRLDAPLAPHVREAGHAMPCHEAAARAAHEQHVGVAEVREARDHFTHGRAIVERDLIEARVLGRPVHDHQRHFLARREVERFARRGARQQQEAVDTVADELLDAVELVAGS